MDRSLINSIILHIIIALLLLVGVPRIWTPAPEEIAISLDLLPVSSKSNVKKKKLDSNLQQGPIDKIVPKSKEPELEKEKAKKEELKEPEKIKNKPEANNKQKNNPENDENLPEKQQVKPEKIEKKKEDKTPKQQKGEAKKEERKKPNKKREEEDFETLLKNLEESTSTKKSDPKKKRNNNKDLSDLEAELNDRSDSSEYASSAPLSMSERDAIRSQIEKHWNIPAGAKDIENMIIVIRISLASDGSVAEVKLLDTHKLSDNFYRAVAESAVRAAYKASPIQNLLPENFDSWKELELTFNPSQMVR